MSAAAYGGATASAFSSGKTMGKHPCEPCRFAGVVVHDRRAMTGFGHSSRCPRRVYWPRDKHGGSDMRTDTHAERNHKIVVGTVVAVIAAAGIGTLAMNAHRLVVTRSARLAAPAAAFPDKLAPQASPALEANPPPVTSNPLPPTASTLKPETAAPATEPAQSTAKPEPQ